LTAAVLRWVDPAAVVVTAEVIQEATAKTIALRANRAKERSNLSKLF
jgi:hypothetical protein